jgi:hypothetical protein
VYHRHPSHLLKDGRVKLKHTHRRRHDRKGMGDLEDMTSIGMDCLLRDTVEVDMDRLKVASRTEGEVSVMVITVDRTMAGTTIPEEQAMVRTAIKVKARVREDMAEDRMVRHSDFIHGVAQNIRVVRSSVMWGGVLRSSF